MEAGVEAGFMRVKVLIRMNQDQILIISHLIVIHEC